MVTKEKHAHKIIVHLKNAAIWLLQIWDKILLVVLLICLAAGCVWYEIRWMEPEEIAVRQTLVDNAETYLGCNEADGSHERIVDLYNSYAPSPRDYQVTYDDNWCAVFGSAMALETGLNHIIPMECSCEQQIQLYKQMGCWQEDECYLPQPGDYIYYVWDEWRKGDCTAWANHVGIVAETFGPVIKVIEGNKDDSVSYRYIFLNDIVIRGFGLPDYYNASK